MLWGRSLERRLGPTHLTKAKPFFQNQAKLKRQSPFHFGIAAVRIQFLMQLPRFRQHRPESLQIAGRKCFLAGRCKLRQTAHAAKSTSVPPQVPGKDQVPISPSLDDESTVSFKQMAEQATVCKGRSWKEALTVLPIAKIQKRLVQKQTQLKRCSCPIQIWVLRRKN